MSQEQKEQIRQLLRKIKVPKYFVAPVTWDTIEWFEDNKWFTLPNDYRWFLRHLGHGGVGFETLGMKQVSERLHIFYAMQEAQRLHERIPMKDFLLIQHLTDGDFYYIETSHTRQEREVAPVYRWLKKEEKGVLAYPSFYAYFLHQLQLTVD